MSRIAWIALGLAVCGVALVVAGVIVGRPEVALEGAEGAYFNRSDGGVAYAGVLGESGPGLFDPADGNLWIGAGIMALVAAVVLASLALARRDR